jgi:predicted RNA-binding Zn ribbon-like protein
MTTDRSTTWTFDLSGGRLCLDFVNTLSGMRGVQPKEHLRGYADLVEFARQSGVLADGRAKKLAVEARRRPDEAARVYGAAVALREALYRVFLEKARGGEPDGGDLELVQAALRDALVHRRLVRAGDAFAYGWEETAAALEAPLWPIVASAAEVLTSAGELARVRVCGLYETSECSWLFVDETRAHTRRWCSMKDCGNRAKARRHWARTKEEAEAPKGHHRS